MTKYKVGIHPHGEGTHVGKFLNMVTKYHMEKSQPFMNSIKDIIKTPRKRKKRNKKTVNKKKEKKKTYFKYMKNGGLNSKYNIKMARKFRRRTRRKRGGACPPCPPCETSSKGRPLEKILEEHRAAKAKRTSIKARPLDEILKPYREAKERRKQDIIDGGKRKSRRKRGGEEKLKRVMLKIKAANAFKKMGIKHEIKIDNCGTWLEGNEWKEEKQKMEDMLRERPDELDAEGIEVLKTLLDAAKKGTEEEELLLCQMFGVTGTEGGRRRRRKSRRKKRRKSRRRKKRTRRRRRKKR